jgi:hypothetical protein
VNKYASVKHYHKYVQQYIARSNHADSAPFYDVRLTSDLADAAIPIGFSHVNPFSNLGLSSYFSSFMFRKASMNEVLNLFDWSNLNLSLVGLNDTNFEKRMILILHKRLTFHISNSGSYSHKPKLNYEALGLGTDEAPSGLRKLRVRDLGQWLCKVEWKALYISPRTSFCLVFQFPKEKRAPDRICTTEPLSGFDNAKGLDSGGNCLVPFEVEMNKIEPPPFSTSKMTPPILGLSIPLV